MIGCRPLPYSSRRLRRKFRLPELRDCSQRLSSEAFDSFCLWVSEFPRKICIYNVENNIIVIFAFCYPHCSYLFTGVHMIQVISFLYVFANDFFYGYF